MPAPPEIIELVERFRRNLKDYQSGKYNETQVRLEFIDPFFESLGWDVHNKKGYAEAYKDVVHEDQVKVGGGTKAPDYGFRIGGTRKFFVEAKKPSINIKDDVHPAYQLRRYAWSAKLPLSVLTDFEELAVYDCRIRPVKTDKTGVARVMYFTFEEYVDKWDEINGIFGREAVLRGSFDRYAESSKRKRGTAEVDTAFLEEIERWRDTLARNIALRNPGLTVRDLNFAVQRTIDRLIFLRIAEDRGLEPYGQLQNIGEQKNSYEELCRLYLRADDKYNSGLFHFKAEKDRPGEPDEFTVKLKVDEKVIDSILRNLYYPDSPYEFSVLPADILGQVYEQFLGKVIRLTAGGQAKVEDKPEVKKAGGVYYTPTYIVDYIVAQTVGALLEDKTPKSAANLRICDPACGSGSFLLGAYQHLLNWHRDYYVKDGPEKWAKTQGRRTQTLWQGPGGEWRLTTAEKRRILLNNIYGVDIDPQAVEVTKLSLLLKVLEGENEGSLQQMAFFQERALPALDSNIKCGNSLIGPDYYAQQGQQLAMFDMEEMYRINAFDWDAEFPRIMRAGGFDAVIGNPPWGAEFSDVELEYHRKKNKSIIVRMIDSFMYFVYQSSKKLKPNAFFGMILPDVILYQKDNLKLRTLILEHFRIHAIANMGNVFYKVTRPACILIFENDEPKNHIISVVDFTEQNNKHVVISNKNYFSSILQNDILSIPGSLFITENIDWYDIWAQVNRVPNKLLVDIIDDDGIQRGVSPDLKDAFLVDRETALDFDLEKTKLRNVVTGGIHVKRYFIKSPDLFLIYTTRYDNFKELPNICNYVNQYKDRITCREVKDNKHPLYALHRPRKEQIFLKERKFLGVITEDEIIVSLDDSKTYATDGLYIFYVQDWVNEKFLLGVLNSKLFVFIYRLLALEKGRVLAQVKPTTLKFLPIRTIDFKNPIEATQHDQMVALVESMLGLHKQLAAAKSPVEKQMLQRQIETTDKQIDALVYTLYGLTEEEIQIVEGA